jgi:integrase
MSVFRRKNRDGSPSKYFSYDFWVAGRRYRGVIKEARTKAQAERAEIKIRDGVYEERYGKAVEAPTLAEFVEKTYLPHSKMHKRSSQHDEFRSRPLVAALGRYRLDEISQIQIEKYKRDRRATVSRRGTEYSPASVNRELELLSAILTHAIRLRLLPGPNPCRDVERLDEDNERTRVLSYEEEGHLMEQLVGRRAHLRPIVQLAIQTTLRKSELLGLRKANLDFERNLIRVENNRRQRNKSKRPRFVPMNSLARQLLLELCRASASEYVFPNKETGGHIKDVKTAFNSACDDAGIEDFVFHDLRRTGATRLGDAGANAFHIAAILGHEDVNTSQIYTVATDSGLRRAMESLAGRVETDTEVPTQEERRPVRAAVNS